MTAAGYSGTPLERKLGLEDGQSVAFVGLPAGLKYLSKSRAFFSVENVAEWPGISDAPHDYIHIFTDQAATVDAALPELPKKIRQNGMIWVSWPKKVSKVPTDLSEDKIRARALQGILVDVKVCAIDQVWSGLKLVIRKEHRK